MWPHVGVLLLVVARAHADAYGDCGTASCKFVLDACRADTDCAAALA